VSFLIVKKYLLNCHLKNETDKLYEKSLVCVVLTNCPIDLLTVQKTNPFGTFWTVRVFLYIRWCSYEKSNGWRQSNVL